MRCRCCGFGSGFSGSPPAPPSPRDSHHHAPAASDTTASAANAPRMTDGLFLAPSTGRFAAEVTFVLFPLLPFQAICRSFQERRNRIISKLVRCYARVAHDSSLSACAEIAPAMIWNDDDFAVLHPLEYHVASALTH
jgi:hypothetical protein